MGKKPLRVTFDLPDAAAERLRTVGEVNGIPVGAAASLIVQASLFGRSLSLQMPWRGQRKKAGTQPKSGSIMPMT